MTKKQIALAAFAVSAWWAGSVSLKVLDLVKIVAQDSASEDDYKRQMEKLDKTLELARANEKNATNLRFLHQVYDD